MGMTSHIFCVYDIFFLSHSFFFDDESDNDESGSSGTCAFPFCSGDSIFCVSVMGSGVFVQTGIKSISDVVPVVVFVPKGVTSKVG